MLPKELLRKQFAGGVFMLMDGLVSNLVDGLSIPRHTAEKMALEELKEVGKEYGELTKD